MCLKNFEGPVLVEIVVVSVFSYKAGFAVTKRTPAVKIPSQT
jgi:hypothetical protein